MLGVPPFYTGKQKVMDTAGRVEKFRQRYRKTAAAPKGEAKSRSGRGDLSTKRGSGRAAGQRAASAAFS